MINIKKAHYKMWEKHAEIVLNAMKEIQNDASAYNYYDKLQASEVVKNLQPLMERFKK